MISEKGEAASLFEKLTIKEVQDIERKTRNEIEKRREDLRQMVGERYRDLIEAADTIRDMNSSVESVSDHVKRIHDFNFKDISVDNFENGPSSQDPEYKTALYAVAAQIHFLLDIPEKIWNFMEKEDVLTAAILYLMAEDVHASLKFEPFFQSGVQLRNVFPIVTRHWASCTHFHASILKHCMALIESRCVNESIMTNSLCAILLLSKKSPRDLCNVFLDARINALNDILKANQPSNAKDQTIDIVRIISESLRLFQAIFYSGSPNIGEPGLLLSTLKQLLDARKGKEIVCLVVPGGTHWIKYIPKPLQNFTPELTCTGSDFSDDFLKDSCVNWLSKVKKEISPGLKEILSYVGTIRGMAIIRKAVIERIVESNEEHSTTCLEIEFNLWKEFLNPIFIQQIQFIMSSYANAAGIAIKEKVEAAKNLISNQNQKQCIFEKDLSKFVWTEERLETSVGLLSSEKRVASLTLKAKGFTPTVENICKDFDERWRVLLEDVVYMGDLCLESSQGGVQIEDDIDCLQVFLREVCLAVVNSIMEFLQTTTNRTFVVNSNLVGINLFYSRLCLAIGELCPHLQKTIVAPNKASFKPSDVSVLRHQLISSSYKATWSKPLEDPVWQEVRLKLSNKCIDCLRVWRDVLKNDLSSKFQSVFAEDAATLLNNIPQWDTVEIQEESEDGLCLKSTISVPFQPSFQLEESLYWMCSKVNRAGGHTIPRIILRELQDDVLNVILASLENLLQKSNFESQTHVLQLLFDLRFVAGLLAHSIDEENRDRVQHIKDELESRVDPFDLDVFMPYINENLKRCIHRSTVLLGPLSGSDHLTTRSPAALSHQEQYNVIPLSSGCKMRFTLLPLASSPFERKSEKRLASSSAPFFEDITADVMLNLGNKDDSENRSSSPKLKSSSSMQTLEIAKSASTSFFGAMSSSWFGN